MDEINFHENLFMNQPFLTLIVPKYSATLFMQGGGVIYDPPLISGHSGHKGTN